MKSFPNGPAPPSCGETLASPRGRVVAPDGTVYFLVDRCSEGIALSISHDEGNSWTQLPVTTMVDSNLAITSLAVDRNGTLYATWAAASNLLPYLSISRDGGRRWSKPAMIGAPGVNRIDPRTLAIAVDSPGHIAVAYSGSTNHGSSYNGYMAETGDGLAAKPLWWSTVMNNPRVPLEVGTPSTLYGDREWFATVTFAPNDKPWAGFQCDRTSLCPGDRFGMAGHLSRRTVPTRPRQIRACYRDRRFTVELPLLTSGSSIRSAQVLVSGRSVGVWRRHGRLIARVDLGRHARRTVHVTISELAADGWRYQQNRIYRPCARR